MLSTRAPSGKSMPRKKMSLQPLWLRSMRTGVASWRMGKRGRGRSWGCWGCWADDPRRVPGGRAAVGPPDGRCGTSTGCRAPSARCAAPGWPASESPGGGRHSASALAIAIARSCAGRPGKISMASSKRRLSRLYSRRRGSARRCQPCLVWNVKAIDGVEKEERAHPSRRGCRCAGETYRALAHSASSSSSVAWRAERIQ
jgi:hypothetical protein